MRAMAGCALFGASMMLSGIRDVAVYQHSVIGCQWGTLAFRCAQQPGDIRQASTVIYEKDVIYGGEKSLEKGLRACLERYADCRGICIVSGCVPNMLGDDIAGVAKRWLSGISWLSIAAPGYSGTMKDGKEAALTALGDWVRRKEKSREKTINILGISAEDFRAKQELAALKEILGNKVKIKCAIQDCVLEEIESMSAAHGTVVFGYGVALAKRLQEEFGVPYIVCDYPYGIDGMITFLRKIESLVDVDFTEEIEQLCRERAALVRQSASYLSALYQMPAAIAGSAAQLTGMERFLREELGMDVVAAADADECDEAEWEAQMDRHSPVLLFGSSLEASIAAKRQIPFIRWTYPVFDEVHFSNSSFIGYGGTAYLAEKIVNAILQQPYKRDGLYHRLYLSGKET